jgi:hypothetical protein
LVLEVASRSSGRVDVTDKRVDYARLGISEYWRFDETGEYHGARLGGDVLMEGRYEPVPIEELDGGVLQGYSPVLNLYLRWEDGDLAFYDPDTGAPIATMETERHRADMEREGREAAEARVRELEERLRSRGG